MSTERMRASDAEREQVAQVLRTAMSEGRLSLEEGEERLAVLYAATYRDELTPLTADLPGGGWHALRETPEAVRQARRFVRGRIGVALFLAALLVGLWVLSGAGFFWPLIPLVFIGLMVFRCAGRRSWRPVASGPPWTRR